MPSKGERAYPFVEERIPYNERKGLQAFPEGIRMVALVYTAPEDFEWGGWEPIHPVGTGELEVMTRTPSLSSRSAIRYGFNVGIYRILDILKEHDMKMTFWTNGNVAEDYPVIKEIAKAGHEIGGHSYSEGVPPSSLDRKSQQADIRRCVKILEKATGTKPAGWLSPRAHCNQDTIELLADEGFMYHGDLQDDELPYFIKTGNGKRILEIPYRMVGNVNDLFLWVRGGTRLSTEQILKYLKSTFDASYREAARRPLLFNYGTHLYISGRPDGGYVLSEFLSFIQSHKDVWMPTYRELAEYWYKKFG